MTISHQDGRVLARHTTYAVEHGDRDNAAAAFVTVATTDGPPPPLAWSLAVAAGRARSPEPPEEEAGADAVESQVEIDVDGVTASFETMRLYGRVSGWAAVKDVTVSYVSRSLDVPRIGLAEITDLEPYIEGYRELMRDKGIEPGTRTHLRASWAGSSKPSVRSVPETIVSGWLARRRRSGRRSLGCRLDHS